MERSIIIEADGIQLVISFPELDGVDGILLRSKIQLEPWSEEILSNIVSEEEEIFVPHKLLGKLITHLKSFKRQLDYIEIKRMIECQKPSTKQ